MNKTGMKYLPYRSGKSGKAKRVKLITSIDPSLKKRLVAIADKENITISYLINKILATSLGEPLM
jgi:hypothetical protein